jgi:thioredoxin reductase
MQLSAAMALGRSIRDVLVIDARNPCNKHTPYFHNFLTQDGKTPAEISAAARKQVAKYDTITFHTGFAVEGEKVSTDFILKTEKGEVFESKKLIFAT